MSIIDVKDRLPSKQMFWSSKQTTYRKTRQGKQLKRSCSVDWCRGKNSVRRIFTPVFEELAKCLAYIRRNTNITWHLLCRMKGENLVVVENLYNYKINKLKHESALCGFTRSLFLYQIKGSCEQLMDECILVPLFQNESLCETFHIKMSLNIMKWICRLVQIIRMVLHI